MLRLKCSAQQYAWGKIGNDSKVAQLLLKGGHVEKIDETKPYAELWMGVHPNCPSRVITKDGEEMLLSELIDKQPELLAPHENGTLQFLFKVLSVNQALSVQTHPTKEQAAILHAKDPKNYPDANHKPEMAISFSDNFSLLCGFRKPDELKDLLTNYGGIKNKLNQQAYNELINGKTDAVRERGLRTIFESIWKSSPEHIAELVDIVVKTAQERMQNPSNFPMLERLFVKLNEQYPGGDVGVIAPLFLNYFMMPPGVATFLGPNMPHAYLLGDCIEVMACSDNTIRAGLTPKFKDVETLCTNMNWTMTGIPLTDKSETVGTGDTWAGDAPEFAIQHITGDIKDFSSAEASSILLTVNGHATLKNGDQSLSVKEGDVIFIPTGTDKIVISESSAGSFEAYRAYTPKPIQ